MKLVISIVQDSDVGRLVNSLSEANIRSTKLSSTGGFLKQGNTTLMIGCEEERLQDVLDIIESSCSERRLKEVSKMSSRASTDLYSMKPIEVGGATVFVVPVESFHRF